MKKKKLVANRPTNVIVSSCRVRTTSVNSGGDPISVVWQIGGGNCSCTGVDGAGGADGAGNGDGVICGGSSRQLQHKHDRPK